MLMSVAESVSPQHLAKECLGLACSSEGGCYTIMYGIPVAAWHDQPPVQANPRLALT